MGDALGDRIRALRQRKGWTLKDLAHKTKLSVPYLSDIERREGANPTLDTMTTIAKALGCSVSELLGEGVSEAFVAPLPASLHRFVQSELFVSQVKRLASKTQRPRKELERELVNFLAMAPKRARGDLKLEDWRRLLDAYSIIID